MEIRINEEDHLKLLEELKHLRQQRDELQQDGTRLELENRDLRVISRRIEAEVRRSHIWSRLRTAFAAFLETIR